MAVQPRENPPPSVQPRENPPPSVARVSRLRERLQNVRVNLARPNGAIRDGTRPNETGRDDVGPIVVGRDQSRPLTPGKVTPWMRAEELQEWLEPGDLVEIRRDFFEHWAVFVIRDPPTFHVVHLSGFSRDVAEKSPLHLLKASIGDHEIAEVMISPLSVVARGDFCRINNKRDEYYAPLEQQEILTRALGEVGERRYNLVTTNCEHFATWCRYGSKSSNQSSAWKCVAAAVTVGALSSSATMGLLAGGAMYTACRVGNKIRHRMHRSRSVPWYLNI